MAEPQAGLDTVRVNVGYDFTKDEVDRWISKVSEYSEWFNASTESEPHLFDLDVLNELEKFSGTHNSTLMRSAHRVRILELLFDQAKNILLDPLVRYAIYLTSASSWADSQLPWLEDRLLNPELKFLLQERRTLAQTIIDLDYQTSETKVNFLTHMSCFFREVNRSNFSDETKLVIEFGGGNGGITEILRKIFPKASIVVIDFPEMLVLQSAYLKGYQTHFSDLEGFRTGAINLTTLTSFLNSPPGPPDVFIATWSLSEADESTCLKIDNSIAFMVKHVVFGYRYRDHPDARMPYSNPRPWMMKEPCFHDNSFFGNGAHKYLFH